MLKNIYDKYFSSEASLVKTDKYHKHSKPKNKIKLTLHGDDERLLGEDNI